jgi:para-nitrobenzyl esterase
VCSLANRVVAAFRADRRMATQSELFYAIATASSFRKGAWTQAVVKSARNEAPVYLYELDGQTPIDGGPEPQRLADTKSAAWLTFARTGDPSTPLLPWPTWHSDVGAGFRYREPGVNGFRDDERSCW